MHLVHLDLPGLILIKPEVHADGRGFFLETYSAARYRHHGIVADFVQDNHAASAAGTLRGMHFQTGVGQDKLVRVARGQIFDVAVDLRPNSPTCGRWQGVTLDAHDHHQLFVPRGFAHGYCVLGAGAEVVYKVGPAYDPELEAGFRYDDPDVGIAWPLAAPTLSARDRAAPPFAARRATVDP